MKKGCLYIFFFSILISCNNKLDETIIIGSERDSLPYGVGQEQYGYSYSNGERYMAVALYYNNKIIVYVMDKGYVIDYYFSKIQYSFITDRIKMGTNHKDVMKKLGIPAFTDFSRDWYDNVVIGSDNDFFTYTYLQKRRKQTVWGQYEISPVYIILYFDSKGELYRNDVKYIPL